MQGHQWARKLSVGAGDLEFLNTLLLEREVPLPSEVLARALVDERLRQENEALQERFKDAQPYNPSHSYQTGQRIVFPKMDYAIGEVVEVRPGDNQQYGDFSVISVQFDDDDLREFAADLGTPHALNEANGDSMAFDGELPSADDVFADAKDDLVYKVDSALEQSEDLINLAGTWFSRALMPETNEGHRHLAEAVLDMMGGGPMPTQDIVENIGGLGENLSGELQVFALNYGLNEDSRFDEVGPAGEVMWFLTRLLPPEVVNTPNLLRYNDIPYDRSSLSQTQLDLERDLADELSPIPANPASSAATVSVIYPHRRLGTFPLNYRTERVFPFARVTPRVCIALVDATDGERWAGWVVREGKYVFGLTPFYTKHALPIGASLTVRQGETPGDIILEYGAYKPRSEWVTLVTANDGQVGFENAKRSIGAEYDDLLMLGVDDLEGVDALFQPVGNSKQQPLAAILRLIIPSLGRFTGQGHVHAKTLYSAVNVIRRCPPGPLFATLSNNPDFENVGGNYWKLSQ